FYGCINLGEAYAPQEIERKSVCISEDIGRVLAIWKGRMEDEKQRDDAGGTLRLSDSLPV
ncbi:MAG: Sir2 silent information regulator family NAD-dependent deacetylase, partial [Blautia coccoides]